MLGAVVAAFFVSRAMTPTYEASAKVLVQGGQTPGVPSVSEVQASQQLAKNYGDLVKTRIIMEKVLEELSLPYGSGALSSKIDVSNSRSLMIITASDQVPQLAAIIANTVAQTFIDDFRDQQLTQIAQFQASLSQYGIALDSSMISAQAATLSSLRIVDAAVTPSSPSSPRTRLNILLAAVLGLLLSGGVVFVLDRLDDSVQSVEDLKDITWLMSLGSAVGGITGLGAVVRQRGTGTHMPSILLEERADSPLTESYKYISLSLEFSALGGNFKTLLITSALPGEGKTTTSTNLAISLARSGKSVILVDTDLRKPSVGKAFNMDNSVGLTNALLGEATLDQVLQPTPVDTLKVITSGPTPPDSMLVLHSARMRSFIEELSTRADLVIFDSPPVLVVADPIAIASQVDAVLIVVDAEKGRRESLRRAVQAIEKSETPILGAVLNKTTGRGRSGYYYSSSSYNSTDGNGSQGESNGKSAVLAKIFKRRSLSLRRKSKAKQ